MGSLGTWVVGSIVALIIGLAVRKVYTDRKNGMGCGGGCESCSNCPSGMSGQYTKE